MQIDVGKFYSINLAKVEVFKLLTKLENDNTKNIQINVELETFNENTFFFSTRGIPRVYYKSRDFDIELFGLGIAHLICPKNENTNAINIIENKFCSLHEGHFYLGGMRFNRNSKISNEWSYFNREMFFLPLILVKKYKKKYTLTISYISTTNIPLKVWSDHAITLLNALDTYAKQNFKFLKAKKLFDTPEQPAYEYNINRALEIISNGSDQKVVLGRRSSFCLYENFDSAHLFLMLKEKNPHTHLFFIDPQNEATFFGASPELLYRQIGRKIITESIAGTRARNIDKQQDEKIKNQLIQSKKDNDEHMHVCRYIENAFYNLGVKNIVKNDKSILTLPFVHHLIKRYKGILPLGIKNSDILKQFHPTPAVCGVDSNWAKEYIDKYEGFDRGLYGGAIGFVGKHMAEFSVGIRSALVHKNTLHVYAAGGIVTGSDVILEASEIFHKQKNIIEILKLEP